MLITRIVLFLLSLSSLFFAQEITDIPSLKLNKLTPAEIAVIRDKATERPFSGKYYRFHEDGTYLCKQCNAPLYKSTDKFDSHCGWPSFDDAIPGAVKRVKDADGIRTEIVCSRCGAHLGHVFEGEGFTPKNQRYCVNSISLKFQKATQDKEAKAYFAGGCFWGVEYYLEKKKGVKRVESGYMGGTVKNPSYKDVCSHKSGHYEVVEVVYNPNEVSYEELAKLFFEIHDPTQKDGQGPDIGQQYQSAVFVSSQKERKVIEKLISQLRQKGYDVATKILDKKQFYKAEEYHQNHYVKKGTQPYCHTYVKRF